jgi:hypothetical protein
MAPKQMKDVDGALLDRPVERMRYDGAPQSIGITFVEL